MQESLSKPLISLGRDALKSGWRTFKLRTDFPCSILAANSFDVLGVLDTTQEVIPAFTPADFADDRVPILTGFSFGGLEYFTFASAANHANDESATAVTSRTGIEPPG